MMAPRFVRWLVLLAALWLPLQAVATLSMPYCKHGTAQATDTQMHCEHGDNAAQPSPASDVHACDDCSLCHLAGSSAIPRSTPAPAGLPAARDYALPAERALVSFIPELPQRPPRPVA